MAIERIFHNLHILARAHGIIGEMRIRQALSRASVQALAGLIACFGLLLIDVAVYFSLEPRFGQMGAALITGLGNIGLAAVVFLISLTIKPGDEMIVAKEIQDLALKDVMDDLRSMREDASSFIQNPIDAAMSGVVGHALTILIRQLKSKGRES